MTKFTTKSIHETIIKSAADLISAATPDYQYLQRDWQFSIYVNHLSIWTAAFVWPVTKLDPRRSLWCAYLQDFSKEEFDIIKDYIDHKPWFELCVCRQQTKEGKYLVQDRVKKSKQVFESPQFFLYMSSVCACLPVTTNNMIGARLDYIKRFYDTTSTFKISPPTPSYVGRAPHRVNSAHAYSLNVMIA